MTRRMFRYILATDAGMAPCADRGLVTLATCKPRIRRGAKEGDWVAGFLPRPHERGLLAYAGRVREVMPVGAYEKRFGGRRDAIYRQRPDGFFKRLKPEYHSVAGDFERDVSGPVLVFDRHATWYFGDHPQPLPEDLMHLAAAGRGHRVKGVGEADIARFERWLRRRWPPGIHGAPRNRERTPPKGRKTC